MPDYVRQSQRGLVLFSSLFLILTAGSDAGLAQNIQCLTCHDFIASSEGWFQSPDPGLCGTDCQNIRDKACRSNCIVTAPVGVGFDAALNPGLLVEQRGGKLLVQGVVPGSSADEAGVLIGDEIAAINGSIPGRSCSLTTWSSRESATASVVTLRRDGATKNIALTLQPMREFAALLWRPSQINVPLGDEFSLGMTWDVGANDIRVAALLQGGAAARSGLLVGDRIVSIDARPAIGGSAIARLQARECRFAVKLGVLRDGSVNEIAVASASLLDALSAFSGSAAPESAHLRVTASAGHLE